MARSVGWVSHHGVLHIEYSTGMVEHLSQEYSVQHSHHAYQHTIRSTCHQVLSGYGVRWHDVQDWLLTHSVR